MIRFLWTFRSSRWYCSNIMNKRKETRYKAKGLILINERGRYRAIEVEDECVLWPKNSRVATPEERAELEARREARRKRLHKEYVAKYGKLARPDNPRKSA